MMCLNASRNNLVNGKQFPIIQKLTILSIKLLKKLKFHGELFQMFCLPKRLVVKLNCLCISLGLMRNFVRGYLAKRGRFVAVVSIFLIPTGYAWYAWNRVQLGQQMVTAIQKGDITLAMQLLDHGADPNQRERNGNRVSLKTMLDDLLNCRTTSPSIGDTAMLLLFNREYNLSTRRHTLLLTQRDILRLSKKLLSHGADPNLPGSTQLSPLMMACFSNLPEVVDVLLTAKADVNASDLQGETALLYAAQYCGPRVIATVYEHDANPTVRDANGTTTVMAAAQNRDYHALPVVLKRSSDINAVDKNHCCALMYAVMIGSVENVSNLINSGCNVNLRDHLGFTPLSLSQSTNNARITALLLKAHAHL